MSVSWWARTMNASLYFRLVNPGRRSRREISVPAVGCLECQNLFRKRIHGGRGLAGSDRSENDGSGEQSSLGNGEPVRRLAGTRLARVVYLAYHQEKFIAFPWIGIWRQMAGRDALAVFQRRDIEG